MGQNVYPGGQGLSPACHSQGEASWTDMSQWVSVPVEALPAPCMPHHSLARHRRLRLKIQPGNCWLNIHLFVYYDLCMFRWARTERAVCKTASLVHIVCLCVYKTCACYVVKCAFVVSWQVGIVRIMDCTWASSECLAYGAKIVSKSTCISP